MSAMEHHRVVDEAVERSRLHHASELDRETRGMRAEIERLGRDLKLRESEVRAARLLGSDSRSRDMALSANG